MHWRKPPETSSGKGLYFVVLALSACLTYPRSHSLGTAIAKARGLLRGSVADRFLFILVAIGFALCTLYYHFVAHKSAAGSGRRYIAWLLPWFGCFLR